MELLLKDSKNTYVFNFVLGDGIIPLYAFLAGKKSMKGNFY